MTKIAFISDFDGTITEDDFFTLVSNKYFDDSMLAPWRRYLSGKETHFNALKAMFAQIHLPERELKSFIKNIKPDPFFQKTAALCFKKNIPIYICSAGCDYYINQIIGKELKKYNIKLITNRSQYTPQGGLKMRAPNKNSSYYDPHVGISKKSIVQKLQAKGYQVIFAGDGPPDVEPAKKADVVFAKKILLKECQKEKIKTKEFLSFENIFEFIKGV